MSGELIFITGATGFIGSQVVSSCIRAGFRVRLSIRKPGQVQRLKEIFPLLSDAQFAVTPDITEAGAFHDVLDGVDYVFHIASPMPGKGSDLKSDYIGPAVRGTVSILDAARGRPSIKKVVIMSSVLALMPVGSLSETDLVVKANTGGIIPADPEMDIPEGAVGDGAKYQLSKILAHQASRDWVKEHQPKFVVATVHPTFVVGPSLVQRTAQEVDGINAWFWLSLHSEKPIYPSIMVDVRDVADAVVKIVSAPVLSGTEFILSGPVFTWSDVVTFVRTKYPSLEVKLVPQEQAPFQVDVSSANQLLGMKWRTMEDMVCGVIDQQLSFGYDTRS